GGGGRGGACRSCKSGAWDALGRWLPPAAASARGGSVMTRRSAKPCPIPSLMRSACLASPLVLRFTRRTAVYGPVCTVVWEGWAGNRSPYPDCCTEPPGFCRAKRKHLLYAAKKRIVADTRNYTGRRKLWRRS